MEIRNIESLEESKFVFPVMKELRTNLDENNYLELLQNAKLAGYKLVGAFEEKKCLGLMGYRILYDFVHGKHVYIDDLVVTASIRSKGVGTKLLEFANEVAINSNCNQLRLCTGIDNDAGKRFYERNGWDLKAVVYKTKVKTVQNYLF